MPELLCRPLPLSAASGTATTPGNLALERLGRATTFPAGTTYAQFDLGAAITVNTAALLATDAGAAATWRVQGSNVSNFASIEYDSTALPLHASAEAAKRVHRQALLTFDDVSFRYVRVSVTSTGAVKAGRFVIGAKFEPAEMRDYGWDFRVVDLGDVRKTGQGLDDVTIRGKVMEMTWLWSGLTQAEARGQMLDLIAYAGRTRDLLVCLETDAEDVHNMIGYGKLPDSIVTQNPFNDWYEARYTLLSRLILSL